VLDSENEMEAVGEICALEFCSSRLTEAEDPAEMLMEGRYWLLLAWFNCFSQIFLVSFSDERDIIFTVVQIR
jgi:hypothetical protein